MASFEQELHESGALILKFWIHLPRKAFKKRAKSSDHKAIGGLDAVDRVMFEAYDDLRPLSERVLRRTDELARPGTSWRRVTPAIATSR